MKNLKLFTLGAMFCFILFACGKKDADLARTWQVTGVETETDLPDSTRNAMIANSKLVFTKDGTYTTSGGIGADQGTYTVDKNVKNLSTVSTVGKSSEVYTISKLDNDNLILINNGNTVTCIAVK
ncbi:MAG: hypothetical protein V4721_03735 [Bacteroidota bacterium]